MRFQFFSTCLPDTNCGISKIRICDASRGFYVGTHAGNVLKFDFRGNYLDQVEISPVLDLKSPILDLSLGAHVLVVTTESKVAICRTQEATYVEIALGQEREGECFIGSVVHQGNRE